MILLEICMLREQTREFIQRLSDADLLAYVRTGVEAYEAEAVQFASDEFERRGLDENRVVELTAAVEQNERQDRENAAERALVPLGKKEKIVAFSLGIFSLGLAFPKVLWIASRYKRCGDLRKADHFEAYFGLGLLAFAAMGLLIGALVFVLSHVLS